MACTSVSLKKFQIFKSGAFVNITDGLAVFINALVKQNICVVAKTSYRAVGKGNSLFKMLRQKADEQDSSANMTVDTDEEWRQIVSEPNPIYGVGEFFSSTLRTSSFRVSAVSATSFGYPAGTDEID
ncbi:hypothetical protein PIB30_022649 [Stylosanthes scabra]|uniref:Uncharacterized protein n=1 Tax=Stylosanthes scabra TaxID=79078 RepID=A0ABU6U852_9FABA|nr:hypothetical protein [Stylosanthes scabra]